MVLQDALSGNHPPQHLPIGTLSGAIGHPLAIETGDGWVGQPGPVVRGMWPGRVAAAGDIVQLSDS